MGHDFSHIEHVVSINLRILDLFGRGYSSAPNPHTYRHDSAFYTSQVFFCIHSSPVIWSTFTLVGYSLGGGLAADFASYFSSTVSNLVLIAPSGLIRSGHVSWKNRLLYSTTGLVPEWLVEKVVARRLWTGPETARSVEPEPDIIIDEQDDRRMEAVYTSSHHNILKSNPNSTVGRVVDWQIQHHKGFVPAFISAIRYAPIHEQQHRWQILGERMRKRPAGEDNASLFDKVHIVLGKSDPIMPAEELVEDAKEALGESFVIFHIMDAGHEVPIEKADDIAQLVGQILAE
jgi:pimeloyl-ACP methyl ester carboxylesterase